MPLASDIIYAAFRISGVLANAGRNFQTNGSYYTEGLQILNNLIDEWATERLIIQTIQMYNETLVPGQQKYTVGQGGDFSDIPRPSRIERANVVLISENASAPLSLEMTILTVDGWQAIPLKNVNSTFPLWLYYDQDFPLGNLYVWPIPQAVNQIQLLLWQTLTQPATVSTTIQLPPGYTNALEYCLAREFAIRFPERAHMSPEAMARAEEIREKIRSLNVPMADLSCDQALVKWPGGPYNWRTGGYGNRTF